MSDHLASPALLRKIDSLREKNIGQHIPLPQLVVVGDQSSGKSSLLEILTGIPFPRNVELCTRYATQITSRRDPEIRIEVTIIPGPRASDLHQETLRQFHETMASKQEFRAKFTTVLLRVNATMGIRMDESSKSGTMFSEDVLKIEICGPDEDYLTVIDVPGIFRNPIDGVTTKNDMELVKKMVIHYIKDSRTIILAVLPSNVDIATQEILSLAGEYDPTGERTLGVLTKPDLVMETNAKQSVCNLVLGRKRPLTLGYYIVRCRGADEKDDSVETTADRERMFNDDPWRALPDDRVGVRALKNRLAELLSQIAGQAFPKLRVEVRDLLTECRKDIDLLGPARQSNQEQQLYLIAIAQRFQDLARASLEAQYSIDPAFEDQNLRLITHVVNLCDIFRDQFDKGAHYLMFEGIDPAKIEKARAPVMDEESPPDPVSIYDYENEEVNDSIDGSTYEKHELLNDIDPEDFPDLGDIVTPEWLLQPPKHGIMEWIDDIYTMSRGAELTFNGAILSSAFKEQSKKWEGMTMSYVSKIILVIHRFITNVLEIVCPDPRVRGELLSAVLEDLLQRYRAGMKQAAFLLTIERDKKPYTLNPVFAEQHQKARGNRTAEVLLQKARDKVDNIPLIQKFKKLVIDVDDVKIVTTEWNNTDGIKQRIHDILKCYYAIASRRFLDNIYRQVVDHFLLTGPDSPLLVFSQEWVIRLEPGQLDAIAGESPITKERRLQLEKKVQDLTQALEILKR